MSRILVATVPIVGHINPILPLARALVARGHEVRWYGGRKYATRIEATGAVFVAPRNGRDFDDAQIDAEFPARKNFAGLKQLKFDLKHIFTDITAGHAQDLEALAATWRPDVVIADPAFTGGLVFHERSRVPLVVVGVLPYSVRSRDTAPFGLGLPPSATALGRIRNGALNWLIEHALFRDVQKHWVAARAALGLGTPEFMLDAPQRASLFLMPTIASLEYPRSDLARNVRFIGLLPAGAPRDAERPAWFAELGKTNPVVHVSQGTIANTKPELMAPAIAGLASEDVTVVVATGGRPASELGLTNLPANVRVASFLPYGELLPRTAVMVTNGGYGGVQIALSHGVPLVVAGTTEDKPEVAARVAWSGAGLNLRTATPKPEAVRRAVRQILDQPKFRERARALAAEYAASDAVASGVREIEALLAR